MFVLQYHDNHRYYFHDFFYWGREQTTLVLSLKFVIAINCSVIFSKQSLIRCLIKNVEVIAYYAVSYMHELQCWNRCCIDSYYIRKYLITIQFSCEVYTHTNYLLLQNNMYSYFLLEERIMDKKFFLFFILGANLAALTRSIPMTLSGTFYWKNPNNYIIKKLTYNIFQF